MIAVQPTGGWTGAAFAHEGFCFTGDAELVARVVPFVHEGLSRGEPVLVVAGERVRTLLAEQLGADLSRLAVFAAAESWWRGGHGTLHAYDRDLRALRSSVPVWRLAAEPVWLARDDGRVWSRFEAVANRCYAGMPYYSLCLHDATRLDADVLDAVARTHPLTWAGGGPAPAAAYEDPERFVASAQPGWTQRPPDAVVSTVRSARGARRVVAARISEACSARRDDVLLAAHELVTNALREAGAAEVAAWTDDDTLVVEVSDHGRGLPDTLRGYVPPANEPEGGRGMWLAWSLADDVAVTTSTTGTSIRLYYRA